MATRSLSVQSTPSVSLKQLIARRPVAAYLAMAFTLTWGSMLPLLLSRQGFGVVPIDLPISVFGMLASFVGLALPAFLVAAATDGRAGVLDLLRRGLRWQVGIQWYAVALFGIFAGVILAALTFAGAAPLQLLAQKWPIVFTVFLPGVIVPFLQINLPEEIGWTGALQARLQERYGPIRASLLTAPAFALVHLPAYFIVGWIADERVPLPEVLVLVGITAVFAIFFRLVIMWLYNGSGSIVIVALFHSAFNMLSGQQITSEIIPIADASARNLLVIAVVVASAVIVAVATRGRFARRPGSLPAHPQTTQ